MVANPSVEAKEFLTMPVYCSMVNQTKPTAATTVATIKADNNSFKIIFPKSLTVNSFKAKPRTIREMVCPPALPPVSIRTGTKAAIIGSIANFSSKMDKIRELNVPKINKATIQGMHFLAILAGEVFK